MLSRFTTMPVFWSEDYIASAEEFDTTRKSGWITESLRVHAIPDIVIVDPGIASENDLAMVHDRRYIEAIKTGHPRSLAISQGFDWDPGLWTMACAHTNGMVAAALYAFQHRTNAGSLSSGQHHAGRDSGAGFCTFNGIALAAFKAVQAGARRVLIIDLDAHCAGGTHSLIASHTRIMQLDIAVNPFDSYTPCKPCLFEYVERARDYLPILERRLHQISGRNEKFDLCIYYAGMDPYEDCHIGGLPGITFEILKQREERVFGWCSENNIPVAFGIGGGYIDDKFSKQTLITLHRLTVEAAARHALARQSNATNRNLETLQNG